MQDVDGVVAVDRGARAHLSARRPVRAAASHDRDANGRGIPAQSDYAGRVDLPGGEAVDRRALERRVEDARGAADVDAVGRQGAERLVLLVEGRLARDHAVA